MKSIFDALNGHSSELGAALLLVMIVVVLVKAARDGRRGS
jgi:flagellin-like protein